MGNFKVDDLVVRELKVALKEYDRINRVIVANMNQSQAINPEKDLNLDKSHQSLISYKNSKAREISKILTYWPVWTEYLVKVPGVGPYVGGNLIILYYYKFIPVCKHCGGDLIINSGAEDNYACSKCGKKASGAGILNHRIQERDFPKVSQWWSFMGRAPVSEDGKLPKRKKGVQSKWSSTGRLISWEFTEQVNRHKETDPYKAFLLSEKAKLEAKRPELTKGHRHNMAKNKTAKLFLSHFWQVARVIAGKPVTEPYSMAHLGHVGMIDPFYWDIDQEIAA